MPGVIKWFIKRMGSFNRLMMPLPTYKPSIDTMWHSENHREYSYRINEKQILVAQPPQKEELNS